ncbi:MAG: archaemetzincin family Zn-dependent metalloprotease [bacterium]
MKAIHIVAYGAVDEGALSAIEICLWHSYGFDVKRMPPQGEPAFALDTQRGQYNSVFVLRNLVREVPKDAVRLLGVTEKDLFIPMLSFVFGQAQLNSSGAVVSLARLRQEFYGLPANEVLLCARAVKESVHEIGHTFGLTHCADSTCPMSLSNNVRQVDLKGDELCKSCSIILEENTKHIRTNANSVRGAEAKK